MGDGVANSSDSTHHMPKVCSYPGILPKFAVNDGGLTRGIYTQQMPSAPWCGDNGYALLCKINCASYKKLLVDAVANGEAVTTFSTTTCEDLAAISSFHTMTETMLVSFLSV